MRLYKDNKKVWSELEFGVTKIEDLHDQHDQHDLTYYYALTFLPGSMVL